MQGRIVFLLEEPSMKFLLDRLLPRLLPGLIEGEHFQCIAHEGKSDLDRSIPRKLAAWREPGVRFVIVRDNDNAVCVEIKTRMERFQGVILAAPDGTMCAPPRDEPRSEWSSTPYWSASRSARRCR